MDDLVKRGKIYKAIMPNRRTFWIYGLIWSVISLAFLIPGILIVLSGDFEGSIFILMAVIMMATLPFILLREKHKQKAMAWRYAHFTENDFLDLENQLYNAQPMFNTFFLLDKYLFVPGEGLLLSYLEIQSIETIEHKRNMMASGATVVFHCPDDDYSVMVADWQSYLIQKQRFERMLFDKRDERPLPSGTRKQHTIDIPYIHFG